MDDVVIGGYRRVNVLQTGQNSEVWEVVEESGSGPHFCMKLLLPEKAQKGADRAALKREAGLGMKLSHPNIIRTHKFVANRGNPFILMEYFPSQNLKLRLLRKQWDEFLKPRFRRIIEQAAGALQYVHDQGWIHRDIKPDNLLVNTTAEVRLIDFALAVRPANFFTKLLGRQRVTAGTRSYMSPEQIRGQPLDFRADLYSFGIVLYELAAGRLPFIARSGRELLRAQMFEPAPRIAKERLLTPDFEDLLQRCLSKKRENRPESIDAMLSEMRNIQLFTDEEPRSQENQ